MRQTRRQWDLETNAAHLRDALDELQIAWRNTSESWNDPVSDNYCKTHLEPLGPAVKKSLEAVARMQQILDCVYRDCES